MALSPGTTLGPYQVTAKIGGLHLASDEGVITILYLYFWRESAINLGWLMNAHIPQTILVTS